MIEDISNRLQQVANAQFNGNKSDFARSVGKSPNNFYQYIRGDRTPGAELLCQLTQIGIDINWLLTGQGEMIYNKEKENSSVEGQRSPFQPKEKKVAQMLHIITQRLNEVDYQEEIKLEILKETLNRIVIEQNTHFVEEELKKTNQ